MADEESPMANYRPEFPVGRVKKIMKLDKDINKINAEALYLVTYSTELFLRLLAEKSAVVTGEKKRKTVNLDHLRTAVKRHQPISDFLLDSLPFPAQTVDRAPRPAKSISEKAVPAGTRRIDDFFSKGKTQTESS